MIMPYEEEREEERVEIAPAQPVIPEPEEEEEEESETPEAELSAQDKEDLFGVRGIADLGEDDDLSDLVEVTDEDIMGSNEPEGAAPPVKQFKRTQKRYVPPDTGMGGMRY